VSGQHQRQDSVNIAGPTDASGNVKVNIMAGGGGGTSTAVVHADFQMVTQMDKNFFSGSPSFSFRTNIENISADGPVRNFSWQGVCQTTPVGGTPESIRFEVRWATSTAQDPAHKYHSGKWGDLSLEDTACASPGFSYTWDGPVRGKFIEIFATLINGAATTGFFLRNNLIQVIS
jgi:hypothetical protein